MHGDTALIERFVEGTEVAVSVVDTGSARWPCLRSRSCRATACTTTRRAIRLRDRVFVPARLAPDVEDAERRLAVEAQPARSSRPVRTDLILDGSGRPWFLEVNVAPGMTQTSLFRRPRRPQAPISWVICRNLLQNAMIRSRSR
jgi:D-alanine-D-alanine ligase